MLREWLHHLFNPHCEKCREETEEKAVCKTCEILQQELAFAREEKRILLDKIAHAPNENRTEPEKEYQPINSSYVPWRIRAQMMRENERHTMALKEKVPQASDEDISKLTVNLPNARQSIEDLEKELGVDNAS